jgi:hypothetical protein
LRQLDPASLEAVFRRHAAMLSDATSGDGRRHVAIDGKTLRAKLRQLSRPPRYHILSAVASDTALMLAQLDCDEKSNEIPAVQTSSARLRWTVPWSLSMPCIVEKAFEQAAGANVHLIAQVKANQPALHRAINELCDTAEVFAPGDSLADTEYFAIRFVQSVLYCLLLRLKKPAPSCNASSSPPTTSA